MSTTHHDFFSALLASAGVTKYATAHSLEWAGKHFDDVLKDIGPNEVVIVSGQDTHQVTSMKEIEEMWYELHHHPSEEVHIYRMSKAVWYGIQARLRKREEPEPQAKTG